MFGAGNTYFAGSPVVINVEGLDWPESSPINMVKVQVIYNNKKVGEFRADSGGSSTMKFDISSALRSVWYGYNFTDELSAATNAKVGNSDNNYTPTNSTATRLTREYSLKVLTEYLDENGLLKETDSGTFTGGLCIMGGFTEMERYNLSSADVSVLQSSNVRNGDASTKPKAMPEMVGKGSITSWVDVDASGTICRFYTAGQTPGSDSASPHAPMVVREGVEYTDFLFVNRRGALETCSAQMNEALNISVETKQYARAGEPAFTPSRSLIAITGGGRRSWSMSSGYQTREWAEWWAMEFLMADRWWMWYKAAGQERGKWMPVTVEPARKNTGIYDRSKQQMPSVEFTVTLALEG